MSTELEAPAPNDPRWQRRPLRSVAAENLSLVGGGVFATLGLARDNVQNWVEGEPLEWRFLSVVAVIIVSLLILVMISNVLGWLRFRFIVDDDGLHIYRGGLTKSSTSYPVRRIDGVDLDEPILQRVMGLATLKIQVVGGSDTGAELTGISKSRALQLQEQLLEQRHRYLQERGTDPSQGNQSAVGREGVEESLDHDGSGSGSEVGSAASHAGALAPQVYRSMAFGAERAKRYLLRSPLFWILVTVALGFLVASIVIFITDGFVAAIGVGVFLFGSTMGAVRHGIERWTRVATWKMEFTDAGTRISRGRLNKKNTTLRPGKVSAIEVSHGPIDRRNDWWTLQVAVSAMGNDLSNSEGSGTICSAANAEEVAELIGALMNEVDEDLVDEVIAAMRAQTPLPGWLTAKRFGRWLAPFSWDRIGIRVAERHVLVRTGRWSPTVSLIARDRIQLVSTTAGPIDRKFGASGLEIQMPSGPTRRTLVRYLDANEATALRDELIVEAPLALEA